MGHLNGYIRIHLKYDINWYYKNKIVIVYLGMSLYQYNYISMGDITSFVIYTINLSTSLKDLNNSWSNLVS